MTNASTEPELPTTPAQYITSTIPNLSSTEPGGVSPTNGHTAIPSTYAPNPTTFVPQTETPNEITPPRQPPVFLPPDNTHPYGNQRVPPTQRINSEESEAVALIIGIIAGALIAVVLVILVIVKFKWRNDRSFKVDDSKEYPHGPGAALLGNTASSTTSQAQYQLNGALRNGDKAQMQQKQKKRDSKDIKEWYV